MWLDQIAFWWGALAKQLCLGRFSHVGRFGAGNEWCACMRYLPLACTGIIVVFPSKGQICTYNRKAFLYVGLHAHRTAMSALRLSILYQFVGNLLTTSDISSSL